MSDQNAIDKPRQSIEGAPEVLMFRNQEGEITIRPSNTHRNDDWLKFIGDNRAKELAAHHRLTRTHREPQDEN